MSLFVGCYGKTLDFVEAHGDGIGYFSVENGKVELQSILRFKDKSAGEVPENPSYLAVHPSLPVLYATEELPDEGFVWVFDIDTKTKTLSVAGRESTCGTSAAMLSVSKDEKLLYTVNYSSGPAMVFSLDEQGHIENAVSKLECISDREYPGPNKGRQDRPHPHMHVEDFTAPERLSLVPDLGADCVHEFSLDENGNQIAESQALLPLGSGPRHLVICSSDRARLVLCELTTMLCVVPCKEKRSDIPDSSLQDATQMLSVIDGSDQVNSDSEWTASAINLHPNERFVFCSVRATDASRNGRIGVFEVHSHKEEGTRLEFKCCIDSLGKCPREMKLDSTGDFLFVAHQDSNNIECFAVNPETGELSRDSSRSFEFKTPVALCFSQH